MPLTGGWVRQKIAAVNRFFQVNCGRIAFAFRVHARVDAALRANRVGALHRHQRKQIHRHTGFAQFDDGGKAGQTAADDDHASDFFAEARPVRFGSHRNGYRDKPLAPSSGTTGRQN